MDITLFSFGFKHGAPQAELVWDVRFLPNPYWVEPLRPFTGQQPEVACYVLDNPTATAFLHLLEPLLVFLLESYSAQDRKELRIAVGCTGGKHRSVAVVEHLQRFLQQQGRKPQVYHRDMDKE